MAVGQGSSVAATATGSAAFGTGATVGAGVTNSVALGQNSVATQNNTVSVGQVGAERRITNVAPGIDGTDAVNVDQLTDVHNRLVNTRNDLRSGIAAAVSLVTLTPSAPGRTVINLGWGFHKGANAGGVTVNHRLKIWEEDVLPGTQLMLNAGAGFGTGNNNVIRAGASFEF